MAKSENYFWPHPMTIPGSDPLHAATHLAAIVDGSDDAIISKSISGIIQSWNKGAKQIFGYTAEEAVGQPMLLIIPDDLHHEETTFLARLQKGQRIEHYETIRRRKDGQLIDVSLTISPIKNEKEEIIGASKIARDITAQKKAQRRLAELAVTLESIGDAVLATDTSSRVTYVNSVAERLLGYAHNEIIGRYLGEVFRTVNETTRRPVENPVERVLREGLIVGLANHTVLLRSDGSECPIDDSAAPIKDAEGLLQGVVLVFRDVTERQRHIRTAALLSAIVSSSADAIISKDLSGTMTSWNHGAERIFGYTAAEMIGQSIRLLIPPDRQDEEADILARVVRGQQIDHYETVRRKKNGQLFDISLTVSPIKDEEGRIIGASKIARDITEAKRAQRAFHESQERWRVTLESIGDAVIATDAQAKVSFANSVALDLLGRTKAAVVGRPLAEVFQIVNEETRRTVENPVDRVIREGIVVGLANHTVLLRPNGTEVPLDDSAAPIRDMQGRLQGVVLVFRDITQRKQAELQQQQWNTELEIRVSQRTQDLVRSQEGLRSLASQISLTEQRERRRLATNLHDYLAQLLALARMKIGQARQSMKGEMVIISPILAETEDIMDQCLRYTRTLMAQLSPAVLRDLGLVPALQWLAEQMRQQGLRVDVHVHTSDLPTFDDNEADLLFQAVRELLLNVLRHAQVPQATVSVAMADEGIVVITVEDKGIGFDVKKAQHHHMGEHFGLFSIQERMGSVGGWCVVDAHPGRGTRVELGLLPSAREPHVSHGPRGSHTRIGPISQVRSDARWRVLLVDDHAMVRQGLRSILESYADLEVVGEAADGEEAVDLAGRYQPEIVIMDVNMPRLNGIDATRRIKEASPHIVVIGLSVHTSPQNVEALLNAGAVAVVSKEQAADDLYRTIERVR